VPDIAPVGPASVPAGTPVGEPEGHLVDPRVQQGDLLSPYLFAVGIQAALDTLPSGRALHRWYLDDGVFMGSVAEVDELLRAL